MKNLKKYSILFTVVLLVFGCKSKIGSVTEAKKTVVFPGVPQGNTTIEYTAKINVLQPVQLVSINIINNKETTRVQEFSIVDLASGTIQKNTAVLPIGKYFFTANMIFDKTLENSIDKIEVNFKKKDSKHIYSFKTAVKKAETQMRK